MTNNVIQYSLQLPNKGIVVVGGRDVAEFEANFGTLLGREVLDGVIAEVVNVLNATPPAPQAPPQQGPQGPPDFVPTQYRDRMQSPQQWQPQAPVDNGPPGPAPMCRCNQSMKWVPPGWSQAKQKNYPGFFACPQPRGQQCPPPRQS